VVAPLGVNVELKPVQIAVGEGVELITGFGFTVKEVVAVCEQPDVLPVTVYTYIPLVEGVTLITAVVKLPGIQV
jgi:hypothetical protein